MELIEIGKENGGRPQGGVKRLAGGKWVAWACFPREGMAPLYLVATEDEKRVRAAIAGRYRAAGANVGAWGFLKKIKGIAKSIARAKVIQKIGGAIKSVVNNPLVAKAVGLASFVPGIGTAIQAGFKATKAAVDMLEKAKQGNPQARAQIKAVTQAARQGNPAARKAAAVLTVVAQGRGQVVNAQRGQAIPGIMYQGRPVVVGAGSPFFVKVRGHTRRYPRTSYTFSGDLYSDGLQSM